MGASRLHAGQSRRARSSGSSARTAPARRPCCTWPSACSRRPRGRSRCSAGEPGQRPGPAGQGWLRGPGHPGVRGAVASPTTCVSGAHLNPGWDAGSREQPDQPDRPRPRPAGGQAVRGTARPARPHPGHRQAAPAAHPGRAGREPGSAGPPRVPPGPDGGRGRPGAQRHAFLASGRRPGTGLRLPRSSSRPHGCRSPATSTRCWPATIGYRRPPRSGPLPERPAGHPGQPHRPAEHAAWFAPASPVLDPAWTVEQLSMEDLVLAYMSQAADGHRSARPTLEVQR